MCAVMCEHDNAVAEESCLVDTVSYEYRGFFVLVDA